MVKKRIVIPKRYLKKAKQKGTRATRNKLTGRLTGRRTLKSGMGDKTKVRYITQDLDLDGDKKPDVFAGHLFGRTKKPKRKVRASSKRRGTIRRFS